MGVLILIITVLLVPCGSRELPNEYSEFLAEIRPFQDLSEDQPQSCDVPSHQDGVTIIRNNKTVKRPVNANCEPRMTPVDLRGNQPAHVLFVPVFVELHRCSGVSNIALQLLHRCAVTEAEEISVRVVHIHTGYKNVKMLNHTKCREDCIKQASDCDSSKEVYSKESCACKCRQNASSCNTTYKTWDEHNCQCICKHPKTCEENSGREEWNKKTCQCDCLQSIKNRCVRKGKQLDRASCSCVCPAIVCPTGTKLDMANCTCV